MSIVDQNFERVEAQDSNEIDVTGGTLPDDSATGFSESTESGSSSSHASGASSCVIETTARSCTTMSSMAISTVTTLEFPEQQFPHTTGLYDGSSCTATKPSDHHRLSTTFKPAVGSSTTDEIIAVSVDLMETEVEQFAVNETVGMTTIY